MKRIKYEEIQNSIQKYVKQRNLSTPLMAANIYNETDMKGRKNSNPHLKNKLRNSTETKMDSNLLTDLNLMALNDLVLIESSLINYYSFSFNSVSDQDYLKQYKIVDNYVQQSDLNQILLPLFVYMCIDLVLNGHSIVGFIEDESKRFNKSEAALFQDLLEFNENKDLNKCNLVNNWLKK